MRLTLVELYHREMLLLLLEKPVKLSRLTSKVILLKKLMKPLASDFLILAMVQLLPLLPLREQFKMTTLSVIAAIIPLPEQQEMTT
jgi:hypothetical protein